MPSDELMQAATEVLRPHANNPIELGQAAIGWANWLEHSGVTEPGAARAALRDRLKKRIQIAQRQGSLI